MTVSREGERDSCSEGQDNAKPPDNLPAVELPAIVPEGVIEKSSPVKAAPTVEQEVIPVPAPIVPGDDQLFYVLGVSHTLLLVLAIGAFPAVVPVLYSVEYIAVMTVRFIRWRPLKWHYLMLDFCYFANIYILAVLWVLPKDGRLFQIAFAMANGPMAWGAVLFQNALSFNDMDRQTSLMLHLVPAIVTYCMRWQVPSSPESTHPLLYKPINESALASCVSPLYLILCPIVAFCCYQMLYYLFVQRLPFLRRRIEGDKDALTTYRWLFRHRSGGLYNAISVFGQPWRVIMFGVYYSIAAAITTTFTYAYFHLQWLHGMFLLVVTLQSVYHAAKVVEEETCARVEAQKRAEADRVAALHKEYQLQLAGFLQLQRMVVRDRHAKKLQLSSGGDICVSPSPSSSFSASSSYVSSPSPSCSSSISPSPSSSSSSLSPSSSSSAGVNLNVPHSPMVFSDSDSASCCSTPKAEPGSVMSSVFPESTLLRPEENASVCGDMSSPGAGPQMDLSPASVPALACGAI